MNYETTTEKVAKIRAILKQEFPQAKFSITKRDYNSMSIAILSAPINFLTEGQKYESANNYYIESHYASNPKALKMLTRINEVAHEGVTYRETGDYGTQPSFYVDITIGRWDKPYIFNPIMQNI